MINKYFFFRAILLSAAIVSLSAFVAAAENASAADSSIRVLSFNIRLSWGEKGTPLEWRNRKAHVAEIIKSGDYDFVGIQEAIITMVPNFNQQSDLKKLLPGYGMLNRSREVSRLEGESTPILYKKDRWKMDEKQNGVFWLSAAPDAPGSKGTNAGCPRTVVWARFLELNNGIPTGKTVYFINTHFDHLSETARQDASILLANFIADRKNPQAPVILTGDFNCDCHSPAMRLLKGETIAFNGKDYSSPIKLQDAYDSVHPNEDGNYTYHQFGKVNRGNRIDFIWTTPDFTVESAQIIRNQKDGQYPSDHFPVQAVVK